MAMEIPGKCMNRLNQIPTAFNLFRQLAEILDFDGLESFGHSLYRSDLCKIKIMGFLLNFSFFFVKTVCHYSRVT